MDPSDSSDYFDGPDSSDDGTDLGLDDEPEFFLDFLRNSENH